MCLDTAAFFFLLASLLLSNRFSLHLSQQFFDPELDVLTLNTFRVALYLGNRSCHWAGVVFVAGKFLSYKPVQLIFEMRIRLHALPSNS